MSNIFFGDAAAGFLDGNMLLHAGEAAWAKRFATRSVSNVLVNFVLSRHRKAVAETLIERLSRYLQVGGNLRIADVDFAHASDDYIKHAETFEPRWHITLSDLCEMLFRFGFSVHVVEYHDTNKLIHVRPRDPIYGSISRSRLTDPRADHEHLRFSCLIVDAVLQTPEAVSQIMTSEDVIEVFRGTLNRDPDCEAAIRYFISHFRTTDVLATHLLSSREFRKQMPNPPGIYVLASADYEALYKRFHVESYGEVDGFYIGALGDHTDIRFNSTFKPGVQRRIPRDPEHWASLYSACTARRRFVAVELGAGWGPWLVKAALAARRVGISDIRLAAVEPDPEHFRYLHDHLARHELEPAKQLLFRGTVGAQDNVAYFPILDRPSVDWGARAISLERYAEMKASHLTPVDRLGQRYAETPEYSIKTVLEEFETIDLLHIDIQGHELSAIGGSLDVVNNKVRIMFVGTHSAEIDAELIKMMSRAGWTPMHIKPRYYSKNAAGGFHCSQDGEQLWRNNRPHLIYSHS